MMMMSFIKLDGNGEFSVVKCFTSVLQSSLITYTPLLVVPIHFLLPASTAIHLTSTLESK